MAAPDFAKPAPDFTTQLKVQTERIAAARVVANAIVEGEQAKKVLERMSDKVLIKGLKEQIAAAKEAIAEAKAAPAALHESTKAFVATCTDLRSQVDAMHDDLKFEASQLGNGGESSSTQSDK